MTAHEWKVLMSFGLLLGAISLFDPPTAKIVAGVAIAVIVVRNSDKIPYVGSSEPKKAAAAAPATHTIYV